MILTLSLLFFCFSGFCQTYNKKTLEAYELEKQALKKANNNDFLGSVRLYTSAIKIRTEIGDPCDQLYRDRSVVKYNIEDYRGAIKDVTIYIDSYNGYCPHCFIDYKLRADSKYNIEDYKGAIEDYTKAIDLLKKNRRIMKDDTKAIDLGKKNSADFSSVYYWRGQAKLNLNDLEGACLDWSVANDEGSDDAYTLIKEHCN